MATWIRSVGLLIGMALTFTGLWGSPAAPAELPQPLTLSGLVERLPATPDSRGEWRIGGVPVIVGPQTRFQEDIANIRTEGYWTQAGTGVVVWAPGWSPEAARAAGFRQALRREVGGIGVGRLVEAKVRPGDRGVLHAVEIILRDGPSGPASR